MLMNIKQILTDRNQHKMSLNSLASKYGRTWQTIKKILMDAEQYSDTRHAPQRNSWNENFFDQKTFETAYWAGFAFADGCVTRQKYGTKLHIVIQDRDSEHLHKFADAISYPSNKIMQNKTKSQTIQIYSHGDNLLKSLEKWGIVPRKSYNFVVPQIPNNLVPHFLRGWFDGDGHISIKRTNQRMEIVGNWDGLKWYAYQIVTRGFHGHINFQHNDEKVWGRCLVTGINQIRQIGYILHADGEVTKLERKWNQIF